MYSIRLFILFKLYALINAGYLVKDNQRLRDEINLHKFFQPIRRLIKDLPHHDVEVQLEVIGTTTNPEIYEPQRRFRYKKQPKQRRNKLRRQNADVTGSAEVASDAQTTAAITSAATTTVITNTIVSGSADTAKKPVFMDDLKKALNDLEKKIKDKNKGKESDDENQPLTKNHLFEALGCKGHNHKDGNNNDQNAAPSFNVDRILNLLQKGIAIKRDVPSPNDKSLHWMQIKIPKGLDIL